MKKSAGEILKEATETHAQRAKVYGDNYKRFGGLFLSIFPDGELPAIKTVADANRLQLFMQLLNKMTRYAENLTKGGHQDSARDMIVYAALLEEMTDD